MVRREVLFLAYYIAYTTYLIMDSTRHASLPSFSTMMIAFVIPITVVTLAVLTLQAIREKRQAAKARGGGNSPE